MSDEAHNACLTPEFRSFTARILENYTSLNSDMRKDPKYIKRIRDFINIALASKTPYYDEMFTGMVVPYFDFDKSFETEEELEEFTDEYEIEFLECVTTVIKGMSDNPEIFYARAHGKSAKPNGKFVYKFSYHIVVRNAGIYEDPIDIKLKYCKKINESISTLDLCCDEAIYKPMGKEQCFRTIYAKKRIDVENKINRFLQPISLENGLIDEIDPDNGRDYGYACYFPSVHMNEKIIKAGSVAKLQKAIKETFDGPSEEECEQIIKNSAKNAGTISIAIFSQVLGNLNKDRFSACIEWCKLLWASKRWQDEFYPDNEDEIIDLLDNFSSKCSGYVSREDVAKTFNSGLSKKNTDKYVTMGTIVNWLKTDQPNTWYTILGYNQKKNTQIVNDSIHPAIVKLFNSDRMEQQFADCFVELFGENFKIINDKQYVFQSHIWRQTKQNDYSYVRNMITQKFYALLRPAALKAYPNIDDRSKLDMINKQITKLGVKIFKDNISALVLDQVRIYEDIFDTNAYLVGFNNGVYDLKTQEFRDGQPSDYISISTGYDYSAPDADKIDNLRSILDQIIVSEEERKYMYTILSTGLSGINITRFGILTGMGANGKSMLFNLAAASVGNYSYLNSSNVLTDGLRNGSNPEVANINKMRFVYYSEIKASSKIDSTIWKKMAGESSINARLNNSNDCNIKVFCTSFLLCNEVPAFDKVDDALLRRLYVARFSSLFKAKSKMPDYEHIPDINLFEGNSFYETEEFRTQYRMSMFHILAKYFINYIADPTCIENIPESYKKECDKYLANTNELLVWWKSTFRYVPEVKSNSHIIRGTDLYSAYKQSELYINQTKAKKREMTREKLIEALNKNPEIAKYYVPIFQKKVGEEKLYAKNCYINFEIYEEQDTEDVPLQSDLCDRVFGKTD